MSTEFSFSTPLKLFLLFLSLCLISFLPILGFYLGTNFKQKTVVQEPAKPTEIEDSKKPENTSTWSMPVSTEQGIPIVKNEKLYVYHLNSKTSQDTGYITSSGSGTLGQGGDRPILSPDGKFIAFINKQDNSRLYLLPISSKQALKLTDYPVAYLTDWSKDSTKILFYLSYDSLASRKDGPGADLTAVEKFNPAHQTGFHTFSITDGKDTNIYPISGAQNGYIFNVFGFIDTSRLLVEYEMPGYQETVRHVLFDTNTFVADYLTLSTQKPDFATQRSFSANGTLWAHTSDSNSTDKGVDIMFSNFPSWDGVIVDSAPFAHIQRPIINSTGKLLAYQKRGAEVKPGMFAEKTIFWDTSAKKKISEINGRPLYWVTDNQFLVGIINFQDDQNGFQSYDLYDVTTKLTDNINP